VKIKRPITGREVVIPVRVARLDFGNWPQDFYREFYGRRRKRVLVKIVGEYRRTENYHGSGYLLLPICLNPRAPTLIMNP